MVKNISAIFTGLIAGMAAIFFGIMIITTLKPYPADIDIRNTTSMDNFVATFPETIYMVKLLTNIVATFCAGLLSSLVANKIKYQVGIISVTLLFAFMIYRDLRFDYSVLYIVLNIVLAILAGWAGIVTGSRRNIRA